MKATIKETKDKVFNFPRLMISEGNGNIVLATRADGQGYFDGMVVAKTKNGKGYEIGEARTDWIFDAFKVFDGEVTLSN